MKKLMLVLAGVAVLSLLMSGAAMAQKKTLAVVVKGLDNPFFTVLGNGCELWNKENPSSEYKCVYTGPASSADEAGEVRIVEDLINSGAAGIAISPSNAPLTANLLRQKQPQIPVMTIDADLSEADRDLRLTYLGTDNYNMGVLMAQHLKQLKADGGTVCLQLGTVEADNINARASGFRDTISGTKGIERLNGESEACQEFFTDVRIPDSDRMGEIDAGWTIGQRWMYHERFGHNSPYVTMPVGVGKARSKTPTAVTLARKAGKLDDPAAQPDLVLSRIRELERKLSIPSERLYRTNP